MMLSTAFYSPLQTLKLLLLPHLKINSLSRFSLPTHNQLAPSSCCLTKSHSLQPTHTSSFLGFYGNKRFGFSCNRQSGLCANAEKGESGESKNNVDEADRFARSESTMPERFRYLTKEVSDPSVKWPWFVGDPITSLIRCLETAIYTVRAFCSGIVAYSQLTLVIVLASAVLAIAEATVPNAISSQPYLLTLSGLIGYAAVGGHISDPFFWTLLLGMYDFSRLIKKRDDVTSSLPVAAVLAAVGEPWARVVAMALCLALAIFHHSNKLSKGKEEVEVLAMGRKVPLPLFGATLAIGIRVAAKWAGYRHLTWMVVLRAKKFSHDLFLKL